MTGPRMPRNLEASVRRELEVATAVARERLMDVHVEQALELIEHAQKTVSPTRTLDIYARLHQLDPGEQQILTNRVLARLGRGPQPAGPRAVTADTPAAPAEPAEWETPGTLFRRLRRRLRGRVHRDLRRWVELHTGRTEVALLRAHVENALRFVEVLRPEESFLDVVQLYARMLRVRPAVAEVLYFLSLSRLGDATLPALHAAAPPDTANAKPADALEQRLLLVTRGG